MDKKSVVHEAGTRIKDVLGLNRMPKKRREIRGSVHRDARGRHRDGFEDAESSDWIYGAIFLVLIVFVLSPGVLLTIPPGRGGLLMSCTTSISAAFVHAILLVALISFL